MQPMLQDSKGRLTPYAFSCGYVEQVWSKEDEFINIRKAHYGISYVISVFKDGKFNTHKTLTLAQARKLAKSLI